MSTPKSEPSVLRKFLSRAFEMCLFIAVVLYVGKDFLNALYFYYLVNYK